MVAEVEDPERVIYMVREGFILHWLLYPSLRSRNLLASRHYSNTRYVSARRIINTIR